MSPARPPGLMGPRIRKGSVMVQATIQAVNLPGLRDAQMLVKHYRQGVSVRVFPEKISI